MATPFEMLQALTERVEKLEIKLAELEGNVQWHVDVPSEDRPIVHHVKIRNGNHRADRWTKESAQAAVIAALRHDRQGRMTYAAIAKWINGNPHYQGKVISTKTVAVTCRDLVKRGQLAKGLKYKGGIHTVKLAVNL